jgi:alpha-glucosidase
MPDFIWWKHGIIYQIYPRSFYDSSGDGIGDIPGITLKLDYLSDLGIDAIWLSPVNTSPMHDFGYDICDYQGIDPIFGTINDFQDLIDNAHKRDIRIIMDLALNHTSYLHPWFVESACSRDSKKRDWYIWHDGKKGRPPNNWKSTYLASAWEWHEATGQYYLHSFLREQPDVNWHNPKLKEAMLGVLQFWLDRGVDGFRLDVVNWFAKDRRFRSNPLIINPFSNKAGKYSRNRPESHDIIKEIRNITNKYDHRMLVGEVFTYPPGDPSLSANYLGNGSDELHLSFDFSLIYRSWNAQKYYQCIKHWYSHIPENGWPCNVLSNHDQPRNYNRLKDDADADKRARVSAMLLLTLRGTPFMYYGEEIGMKNIKIPRNRITDPAGKKFWPFYAGRDLCRTPMQWSAGANAGFTNGNLWLPVDMDFKKVNVELQEKNNYSLLNYYKNLINIRKQKKSLTHGTWKPAAKGLHGILAYFREFGNETVCIALNFTKKSAVLNAGHKGQWKVVFSTHRTSQEHFSRLHFEMYPFEASIIEKIGEL